MHQHRESSDLTTIRITSPEIAAATAATPDTMASPNTHDREMDIVDEELIAAGRQASRERYRAMSHEVERTHSISSASSSSSHSSSHTTASDARTARTAGYESIGGLERAPTQRDLERHPTALSRIHTARSQHSQTVGRSLRSRGTWGSSRKEKPLPNFGDGKPYPPPLPNREEYVVEFDGPDDPLHAQNWPLKKKFYTAVMLGFTTLTSAFTSSIFSAAIRPVGAEFEIGSVTATLGVSLFVLGFATGPTLWAPLSELKGRRLPILIAMFLFSVFTIGVAVAKDVQTVMICRFFAGFAGACPLSVVAAVFSDMFDARTRGVAVTVFSMTVFSGPLLAPFVGGFIVLNGSLGWRWTQYISAIMGFAAFTLDLFFLEETYPPVVLIQKAEELRRRTRNWGIHAKQEEIEVDFRELITKNFSRPLRLLFTEPIIFLLSIYMAFIYGILYLFLTAYPVVFQGIHGFNPGVSGLMYFGMIFGQLIAGAYIIALQPSYLRKLDANNGVTVPEWRLPPVIVGGAVFAAGLFFFAWTGFRRDIPWIAPALSGLLTGFGLLTIFLQAFNYLIDAYLMFAASAIAANTLLRSLAGAAFPLFATQMFNKMGVEWAGTLLGAVGVVLVPIPAAFYYYGARIRGKSKFAPTSSPPEPEDEEKEIEAPNGSAQNADAVTRMA